MKNNQPHFLDLDAVAEERPEVTLKLDGKTHVLQQATVESFIKNTKLLQSLGVDGDMEAETGTVIKIIRSSFPTITEDRLWKLGLDQLGAVMKFARENNGEEEVEKQMEGEKAENPPETTPEAKAS